MKILLTGANGYIGRRLLPQLILQGHEVVCLVRDRQRFFVDEHLRDKVEVEEVDFLNPSRAGKHACNADVAYYLIHSMSSSTSNFDEMEARAAENFNSYVSETSVSQVIYLSGIINDEELSKHLSSRKKVEEILYSGTFHLTVIRAGIIVGSGSSSFEIIRDLCEKLPVMITPRWVLTKTQPVAIRNVIDLLTGVAGNKVVFDQSFDIGGPEVLTYKEMLMGYSRVRGLKTYIFTIPVMTPRLSSYWLYFVTATSFKLARNLVDSMKVDVIARDNRLQQLLHIKPLSYKEAIEMAFTKIEQNLVLSSWKDSQASGRLKENFEKYIEVPKHGVLRDEKTQKVSEPEKVINRIWQIGGDSGWYYATWLWQFRGFIDKFFGGVGLRRGRTNPNQLHAGDALDFWRVLLADRDGKRLLLYAEMKLPGEAWLEFRMDAGNVLHQTATFRPRGLRGRLYWYAMLPFHYFIFGGMIRSISRTG